MHQQQPTSTLFPYTTLFRSAVLNKPVKQQQFSRVLHSVLRPEEEGVLVEDQKSKQLLSEDFAKQFPLRILIAEDNPVNQKLTRSEEHTSELQSLAYLVCRLL